MMKPWGKRSLALLLALVVLMGSWGGLLAAYNSAGGMGKKEEWLPFLSFRADGGIELTCGEKIWQFEDQELRRFFGMAGKVEWLVPRSLRLVGLGGLTGAFLWRQNIRFDAAKRLV